MHKSLEGLGSQLCSPLFGYTHQGRQGNAQPVFVPDVLFGIERRQADVGVVETHELVLPKILLVDVPADSLQADSQIQPDRKHRQAVAPAQRLVVVKHPLSQWRHRVGGFDLDVNEGEPTVRRPPIWARQRLEHGQLCDHVHMAALASERVAHDLLVQPFGAAKVELRGPIREKEPKELREEFSQQFLKAWIMHELPRPVLGRAVRGREVLGRVDDADVREGLGKVAYQPLVLDVVLF